MFKTKPKELVIMKKPLFVVLILSFALSACLPAFLQQQPAVQETTAPMAVQITATLPTPTLAGSTKVIALSPSPTGYTTVTTDISATTTMPTSSATPTDVSYIFTTTPSSTPTPIPTIDGGLATATAPLRVRFYGTLPPDLPSGSLMLSNKSKAEAYLSLQCTTSDGSTTIMEYPVRGTFGISVPAGQYVYVAWVGGKKMTGKFSLGKQQELHITLYKDKVRVEK
jgi:hypothetical protein